MQPRAGASAGTPLGSQCHAALLFSISIDERKSGGTAARARIIGRFSN